MTNLTEKLANTVPSRGVTLAYGEKTTVDGQEMIPVAVVSYGFGGGDYHGEGADGESTGGPGTGAGGGGGGMSVPVGAYVRDERGLTFQPNIIALLAVSIPVICTVGWAVAKIVKAAR